MAAPERIFEMSNPGSMKAPGLPQITAEALDPLAGIFEI